MRNLIILVTVMVFAGSVYTFANEVPPKKPTTKERLMQMVSRSPDAFFVGMENGIMEVSETKFYFIGDQISNGSFDSSQYESRLTMPTYVPYQKDVYFNCAPGNE